MLERGRAGRGGDSRRRGGAGGARRGDRRRSARRARRRHPQRRPPGGGPGRAATRHRSPTAPPTAGGEVLIGTDLGPAEVAELDARVTGIALAAGGVSAHAAIVARSLGIPMVIGVGDELLTAAPGSDGRRRRKQRGRVPLADRRAGRGGLARAEPARRQPRAGDRQPRPARQSPPTAIRCACWRTSRGPPS